MIEKPKRYYTDDAMDRIYDTIDELIDAVNTNTEAIAELKLTSELRGKLGPLRERIEALEKHTHPLDVEPMGHINRDVTGQPTEQPQPAGPNTTLHDNTEDVSNAEPKEELKPCPFCGGKALIQEDYVLCSQCDCAIAGDGIDPPIAAWNRRAEEE